MTLTLEELGELIITANVMQDAAERLEKLGWPSEAVKLIEQREKLVALIGRAQQGQ